MSFGGTVTRGRRGDRSTGRGANGGGLASGPGGPGGSSPASTAAGEGEVDWQRVAIFGTGIALGAALGAGVALLFAPQSGADTRAAIARRGVRLAHQGRDVWDDLRDELQWAARRGKRRIGRRVQRARWAAEDLIDDRRRPDRWRWKKRQEERTKKAPTDAELDERDVQEIVEALC